MGALTETTENGIEVYCSQVHAALADYIADRGIEDMSKEKQSKWNAALIYICEHVFKNTNKLKCKPYDNNNLSNNGISNNNKYDLNIVNNICDLYIKLCYEYDKEISVNGFSFLTGIDGDCIRGWGGNTSPSYVSRRITPTPTGIEIFKKLNGNNEESLSDMLISGSRPPVAILGALNRRHGWNLPGAGQQQITGQAQETAAQIMQKHSVAAQLEPPDEPEE